MSLLQWFLVFAIVLMTAATITLSVLYGRLRVKCGLPRISHLDMTMPPGMTMPPDMNTVNLAFNLRQNSGSKSGIAMYLQPFKTSFERDGLVPIPNYNSNLDMLEQQCQAAYGQDGILVAEAAVLAYMSRSTRDLAA